MITQDSKSGIKSPYIFEVNHESIGMRLDKFLKLKISGIQQSHLEKLIGSGSIRVNQKKSKPSNKLSYGELVSIPPKLKDQKFNQKVKDKFIPLKSDISMIKSCIIKEDNDFIALNKPHGIAVQGGSKLNRHIDGLIKYAFKNLDKHYLVHRLDRDTTGTLLIAKNRSFAKELSEYFKYNTIEKTYISIVRGKMENKEGTIDLPLIKGKKTKAEKVMVDEKFGLKSITKFKVFGYSEDHSLVLLFPKTGRTHQLRVHLSYLGNPILGDKKYGGGIRIKSNPNKNISLKLHCLQMSFPYKNMKKNTVYAKIGNEFFDSLKFLKLDQYMGTIHRYIQNEL